MACAQCGIPGTKGHCNGILQPKKEIYINMKNETPEQRKERKNNYVGYVLSKSKGMVEDEDALVKEAEDRFEDANPLA
jgi:hypothetical protein